MYWQLQNYNNCGACNNWLIPLIKGRYKNRRSFGREFSFLETELYKKILKGSCTKLLCMKLVELFKIRASSRIFNARDLLKKILLIKRIIHVAIDFLKISPTPSFSSIKIYTVFLEIVRSSYNCCLSYEITWIIIANNLNKLKKA